MTRVPAPSGRRIAPWAWLPAVAAPVALIGGWTLAAALRPDPFDPVTQTISALAGRGEPNRWVMTTALVVVGVAHVGTAAALRPAAPAGRLVLAAGGLATIAVALLPLPVAVGDLPQAGPAESDPASAAHAAAAGVAFVALAVWPALAWRRRAPAPVLTARAGAAAGAVLLGLVAWFAVELSQESPRLGLAERVAAGAQALWPLAVVAGLRRRR